MCRWCSSTAALQHVTPSIQEMFGAFSILDVILQGNIHIKAQYFVGLLGLTLANLVGLLGLTFTT
jgi:hypothetical protein